MLVSKNWLNQLYIAVVDPGNFERGSKFVVRDSARNFYGHAHFRWPYPCAYRISYIGSLEAVFSRSAEGELVMLYAV